MRPEIFRLPFVNWPIQGYGLMIVIGFLFCTWLASSEARKRGLTVDIYNFGVVMLLAGLLGGRLFHYVQFYNESYAGAPWYEFFAIWKGGLVFYGGAIGGILGSFLFVRLNRLDGAELFDAISPFIPIGMGFGRLGCLMNGCCYGMVCPENFPLSLTFPAHSPAYEGQLREGLIAASVTSALPVYPVQLMEAGVDFFMCGILWWYLRGPSPRGGGLPLLFVIYSINRFSMEFFRADNERGYLGFTIAQVVAGALFFLCSGIFIYFWIKKVRTPRLLSA